MVVAFDGLVFAVAVVAKVGCAQVAIVAISRREAKLGKHLRGNAAADNEHQMKFFHKRCV